MNYENFLPLLIDTISTQKIDSIITQIDTILALKQPASLDTTLNKAPFSHLHRGGRGFKSLFLHHFLTAQINLWAFCLQGFQSRVYTKVWGA